MGCWNVEIDNGIDNNPGSLLIALQNEDMTIQRVTDVVSEKLRMNATAGAIFTEHLVNLIGKELDFHVWTHSDMREIGIPNVDSIWASKYGIFLLIECKLTLSNKFVRDSWDDTTRLNRSDTEGFYTIVVIAEEMESVNERLAVRDNVSLVTLTRLLELFIMFTRSEISHLDILASISPQIAHRTNQVETSDEQHQTTLQLMQRSTKPETKQQLSRLNKRIGRRLRTLMHTSNIPDDKIYPEFGHGSSRSLEEVILGNASLLAADVVMIDKITNGRVSPAALLNGIDRDDDVPEYSNIVSSRRLAHVIQELTQIGDQPCSALISDLHSIVNSIVDPRN